MGCGSRGVPGRGYNLLTISVSNLPQENEVSAACSKVKIVNENYKMMIFSFWIS